MIRGYAGKGFGLSIPELISKKIKVVNYTNKEGSTMIEYWVYRTPKQKTGLINFKGKPIYKYDSQSYLFCIIVCDNDYYTEIGELAFVQGVRFTGQDINEYLRITNRTAKDNVVRDKYGDDQDRPEKPLGMKRIDPDKED